MPRSNQTKHLLAESLQELMVTTPLEKISVNDIVDHAGVGRNTFYYHLRTSTTSSTGISRAASHSFLWNAAPTPAGIPCWQLSRIIFGKQGVLLQRFGLQRPEQPAAVHV